MLYAALARALLFAAVVTVLLWTADPAPIVYVSELPEGTQYDLWEPERSWMGDGVTTLKAQIPTEAAKNFEQKLRSEGYTEGSVPENVQEQVRCDEDTDIIPDMDSGLWWFLDETSDGSAPWGWYANYTICFYDPNTCMYYYIEFDS